MTSLISEVMVNFNTSLAGNRLLISAGLKFTLHKCQWWT